MKKILLITSLLFISCIYAQPKSLQRGGRVQKQEEISLFRLDRYVDVYYNENSLQSKSERTFDANGNQTLSISYSWNTTTQSFVLYYKRESTYDANGNQTLSIFYNWNTDTQSFVPSSKSESTYDANGNYTLLIGYDWNTDTQSFVPYHKGEYTYDANGNFTLYVSYYWNTDTQSFVPNYKIESTYDTNGNQTLYVRYSWNSSSQSFVPLFKDVRTYNKGLPIAFLTQKVIYKWYSGLGVYKPSFKTEYSTILDTDTQLHRKGVLYQYETNFNVWNALEGDEYNSYEYYTKTASLSTHTVEKNLTLLYPNPVLNVLNIKVDYNLINQPYNVFDSLGRVVLNGKLNDVDTSINVEQLSKGIYYLKVSDKNASKFIKE